VAASTAPTDYRLRHEPKEPHVPEAMLRLEEKHFDDGQQKMMLTPRKLTRVGILSNKSIICVDLGEMKVSKFFCSASAC
jgi:hypothetical protein